MMNIGMPIKRGKPLEFEVGDKITIISWSPNKKNTHMVATAFPAHVLRVFTWEYKKEGVDTQEVMYDVQFDGDTEPDPIPPRVRQPHMYGADWVNIVAKPGELIAKPVKIPAKMQKESQKKAKPATKEEASNIQTSAPPKRGGKE